MREICSLAAVLSLSVSLAMSIGCGSSASDPDGATADPADAAVPLPDAALTRRLGVVLSGEGAGSVESGLVGILCPSDCAVHVADGTVVALTATAGEASEFVGWGGACAGAAATCMLALTADTEVTATFEYATSTVTLERSGPGSGHLAVFDWNGPVGATLDCGPNCSADFSLGYRLWAYVEADYGSRFGHWVACPDYSNVGVCSFEPAQPTETVDAYFNLGRTFGGMGRDRAVDVATSINETVYLTGIFMNQVDFGSTTVTGSTVGSPPWGFVARVPKDSRSNTGWGKLVSRYVTRVVSDQAGNAIIATGYNPDSSGYTWLLQRYASNGSRDRTGGGYGVLAVRGLAIDPSGNVAVVGTFSGPASYGSRSITSAGSADVFVGRLSAGGWSMNWLKGYGEQTGQQSALDVAFDADDNLIVVGTIRYTASVGGDVFVVPSDTLNGFVARYDWATGAHLQSWHLLCNDRCLARTVSVTSAGHILVAGLLRGTANFGGDDLVAPSEGGVFKVEYDAGGNHLSSWATATTGVAQGDVGGPTDIAIDVTGNVVFTGTFTGTLDPPLGPLTSSGATDIVVAKLDGATGAVVWARRAGGPGADEGSAIAVDGAGRSFTAGWFTGNGDFGPSVDYEDIVLLPLEP